MHTKASGNLGEQIAAEYLEDQGCRVLERNAVYCGAETDIILEAYCDERGNILKGAFAKPSFLGRIFGRPRKNTAYSDTAAAKEKSDKEVIIKNGVRYEKTIIFCEVKTRYGKEYGDAAETITAQKIARCVKSAKGYLVRHGLEGHRVSFHVVCVTPQGIEHIKDAFGEDDVRF